MMFRVYLPSGAGDALEGKIDDIGAKGLITSMRENTEADIMADLQRVEDGRKKLGSILNRKEWTMQQFMEEGLPLIQTFLDPEKAAEAMNEATNKIAKTTGMHADLIKLKLAEEIAKTKPEEVAVIVSEVTPIAQACGHSQPAPKSESRNPR